MYGVPLPKRECPQTVARVITHEKERAIAKVTFVDQVVGALFIRFTQAAHRWSVLRAPLYHEVMPSREGMSCDELDDFRVYRLVNLYDEVNLDFVGGREKYL